MQAPNPNRTQGRTEGLFGNGGLHMDEVVIFENSERMKFILAATLDQDCGFIYFDPQADTILEPSQEDVITQIGPAVYLHELCATYKMEVTPVPQTEYQCRRTVRKVLRNIPTFKMERFIQ
jgi:hypothetical protein